MRRPLLSVITTSRNRAELLRKALESVLRQEYPAIEQVVVDAASTDNTAEMLKSYEGKYRAKGYSFKWVSERDSGQGEGMNKGLRMATGEFVTILNSDDFFEPGAVGHLMGVFQEHPEIDIVYGRVGIVHETGERQESSYPYRRFTLHDVLFGGYQIPQPGCIFRKKMVGQVGGFDESLHHVAEHDLFIRFLKAGATTHFLDEVVETMLEHSGRKTLDNYGNTLRETRMVTFRHGGKRFSRYYLLYLKEKYFGGLFRFLERRAPVVHRALKSVFNRTTA